jgi:hypothetical protein
MAITCVSVNSRQHLPLARLGLALLRAFLILLFVINIPFPFLQAAHAFALSSGVDQSLQVSSLRALLCAVVSCPQTPHFSFNPYC